jgi:DNA-binding beta-propeller fold protein YncE
MPRRALVISYALVVAAAVAASLWYQLSRLEREPTLTAVGPRVVSNQTDYPIQLWGDRFSPGMHLEIGKPAGLTVPTVFVDEHHLAAVIPSGTKMSPGTREVHVSLRLFGGDGRQAKGGPGLVIVNDLGFETPYALELSSDGKDAFVASPSTDEVWVVHRDGRPLAAVKVGDGPRALARWKNEIVVAHEYAGELRLLDEKDPRRQRTIPIPGGAQELAVDEAAGRAYVTDHRLDVVHVVDLPAGRVTRDLPVGVNPRAVSLAGPRLVVGNMGSGDVSIVDLGTGAESRVQPMPGISIVGGHTAEFSKYVMAGKAQRAVAFSPTLAVAFAASIGPDIGPNPQKMEVSTNGGIGVVTLDPPAFVRHVSIRQGVPEALALDDGRGLLYAADIATGRVVVLDAKKLAASDLAAASAILGSVALPPPDGIPLIRPRADFGVEGRPGIELHTGPKALRLADGGNTLVVLCRLTGQVVEIDVSDAARGSLRVARSHPTSSPRRPAASARSPTSPTSATAR